jgi:uncharacterized protein YdaU (DUF1376 family)
MEEDMKAWYLRFETKSWTSATQTMTGWECGAYINLLSWSWDNGPVLDDRKTMIMASRCPLAVTQKVLQLKWRLTENGWTNDRLEIERARCLQRSEKAHASAAKRWDANAMPTHLHSSVSATCDGNAIQSQSHSQSQSKSQSNNTTDSLEPRTKRARRQVVGITWDAVSGWQNVTDSHKITWRVAYPNCSVETSLARMNMWLLANPTKAHKTNWLRFITSWFSRTREDGGNLPPVQRPTESNF